MRRPLTVPGLLVVVLFVVFRQSNVVVYNTFFARGTEFVLEKADGYSLRDVRMELIERGYSDALPLVDVVEQTGLDVPFPAAVALLATLPFIAEFLHVVGVRALAANDPNSVPVGEITSGLTGAYVIARGELRRAGARLFFVGPGLALTVLFLFVRQRIALGGDGVFESISRSYALVTENDLQMVALIAVFWLTYLVVTFVAGMVPLGDLTGAFDRGVETLVIVFDISSFTSACLQAVGGVGGQAASAPAGQSDSLGA